MANIIQIVDFDAPELDVYARLTQSQLRNRRHPENALFIAKSTNVIERALQAGHASVSLLMDEKHIAGKAAALHMDAVLATDSSCDPLNRRCVQVSMGTVFQVPWPLAIATPC